MVPPRNSRTRNYLRAAHFEGPEWIPCTVSVMPGTWRRYREALEEVLEACPRLFPDFRPGQVDFEQCGDRRYRAGSFTDSWGCVWRNLEDGLSGLVTEHPLPDWAALEGWSPPDPVTQGETPEEVPDWDGLARDYRAARDSGGLARAHLPHGHMYMRLYYLRGFENLMLDFAERAPQLDALIEAVTDYNLRLISRHLECGAEMVCFGDDLGMQAGLPISPVQWRRYLLPPYRRMFALCRDGGADVYLHSDGRMVEIIPDLVDAGLTILNPQVRANGLADLARTAAGRVCVNLDLDRQLFPFSGPQAARAHVYDAVQALGSPSGGLMLHAEFEPDVPLATIGAVCRALEEAGGPG
jgi:uroporphyrinogen decarboxylase